MYKKFYGFHADPFRLSPDHRFCLHHPSFSKAKAYMRYALERGEGFVMITGAPGTGKTTLIDDLIDQNTERNFNVAKLDCAQLEGDDLLRMVCYSYGIPSIGRDKAEILQRLNESFTTSMRQKKRPLLIVDEAQGLARRALEELRLLTNLRMNGMPLLQIFLVGQEELRRRVTDPALEQLNQRMVAACHLQPLEPDQTASYILHRLRIAGWNGKPRFQRELLPELARISSGIPRRINHILSRLLLQGMLEEKDELGRSDLDMVLTELQEEHYSTGDSKVPISLDDFEASDLEALSNPRIREVRTEPQVKEAPTASDQPVKKNSQQSQLT